MPKNLLTSQKYENKIKKYFSLSGNWTPVSRVTGGDTYHYTNKDCCIEKQKIKFI